MVFLRWLVDTKRLINFFPSTIRIQLMKGIFKCKSKHLLSWAMLYEQVEFLSGDILIYKYQSLN